MVIAVTSQRLLILKAGGAFTVKARELLGEAAIGGIDGIDVERGGQQTKPVPAAKRAASANDCGTQRREPGGHLHCRRLFKQNDHENRSAEGRDSNPRTTLRPSTVFEPSTFGPKASRSAKLDSQGNARGNENRSLPLQALSQCCAVGLDGQRGRQRGAP